MKLFEEFLNDFKRRKFSQEETIYKILDFANDVDSEKLAKFIFRNNGDEYILYPDYDVYEFGCSEFDNAKSIWYISLCSNEGSPQLVGNIIGYDFEGEDIDWIFCISDFEKWKSTNGKIYDPSKKRFVICDIVEKNDYVEFYIDLANENDLRDSR